MKKDAVLTQDVLLRDSLGDPKTVHLQEDHIPLQNYAGSENSCANYTSSCPTLHALSRVGLATGSCAHCPRVMGTISVCTTPDGRSAALPGATRASVSPTSPLFREPTCGHLGPGDKRPGLPCGLAREDDIGLGLDGHRLWGFADDLGFFPKRPEFGGRGAAPHDLQAGLLEASGRLDGRHREGDGGPCGAGHGGRWWPG
jgi:hypothetical protein